MIWTESLENIQNIRLLLLQEGSQLGVLPCGGCKLTKVELVQEGFPIHQEEGSNGNPREPMSTPSMHLFPTTCKNIFSEISSEQLGSLFAELMKKIFYCSNMVCKWVI